MVVWSLFVRGRGVPCVACWFTALSELHAGVEVWSVNWCDVMSCVCVLHVYVSMRVVSCLCVLVVLHGGACTHDVCQNSGAGN